MAEELSHHRDDRPKDLRIICTFCGLGGIGAATATTAPATVEAESISLALSTVPLTRTQASRRLN